MENLKCGKCCACEKEDETVRNFITLDKKTPVTPGGWGCFVCGLPPEGAIAVLCDDCLDHWTSGKRELKFACLGYPGANRRIEFAELTTNFAHDLSKHPEAEAMNFIETACADENLNWDLALAHFREIRSFYQELSETFGANTSLALEHVFKPLSARYHSGERTQQLYEQMMNLS